MISTIKRLFALWRDYGKNPLTYDYVETVLKGLTYKLKKPEIRTELNAHFDESIDYFKAQGFSDDDAYTLAKEAMGSPQEVINSFNEVYNWHYRIHTVASLLALICIIFLMFGIIKPMVDVYQDEYIRAGWNMGMQLEAVESLNMDQKIQFGELNLKFKSVYLTGSKELIIEFESTKRNPFMRVKPSANINSTCDNHVCYITNRIPVKDDAFIIISDNLLYVEDIEMIPTTLTFTLENISGKSETFTLDFGGYTHE